MRFRILLSILIVCALAAWLAAQTKISYTVQCAKADPVYTIPVGDRPGHAFSIAKGKCVIATPLEIAGVAAKEEEYTAFEDISGNRARGRFAAFITMSDGDRLLAVGQGTTTLKEGVVVATEGTWSYTGGTGKLKGIKGKGTHKGKYASDGTLTVEVEGEYQLP